MCCRSSCCNYTTRCFHTSLKFFLSYLQICRVSNKWSFKKCPFILTNFKLIFFSYTTIPLQPFVWLLTCPPKSKSCYTLIWLTMQTITRRFFARPFIMLGLFSVLFGHSIFKPPNSIYLLIINQTFLSLRFVWIVFFSRSNCDHHVKSVPPEPEHSDKQYSV